MFDDVQRELIWRDHAQIAKTMLERTRFREQSSQVHSRHEQGGIRGSIVYMRIYFALWSRCERYIVCWMLKGFN
jgi:hypothetical protein